MSPLGGGVGVGVGVGVVVGVGVGVTTILPGDTLLEDPPHAVRLAATPTMHRASKNCFILDSNDMINPYGSKEKGQGPEVSGRYTDWRYRMAAM